MKMRKVPIPESHLQHDELIINYKQEDFTKIDNFMPLWSEVWSKFQNDICSYIIPFSFSSTQNHILCQQQFGRQKVSHLNQSKSPKHCFSFAYSTRQLKRVITLHSNMEVFSQIRKQITKIFYRVANYFVNASLRLNFVNLFQSIVDEYKKIQSRFTVMIGCLNLVLNKFITRKGLEDQLYSIIYKQLVNHQLYENYVNYCISSIENMRDFCLQITSVRPNEKNVRCPSLTNPAIENIKILNQLKIFPYVQHIERSKRYYGQILTKIPNNIWMIPALYALVKFERMLQNIIVPDEEQLQRAKKILKTSPWRALQQQTLVKIFCKQALEEIYDDMIEYVEFLIDFQSGKNFKNQQKDLVLNLYQKKQLLRHLWFLAKILQKNFIAQKLKNQSSNQIGIGKGYQRKSPILKLFDRVLLVIVDIKKFINSQIKQQNQKKNSLYKIINFKNHILSIVSQCFDNDFKYISVINSKIEQVITEEQQTFNQKLCSIILSPSYKFPQFVEENQRKIANVEFGMIDENQQMNRQINNQYSFQLFKLTSCKDEFIRKFQQQFSNYVIPFNKNEIDLSEQQLFIKPIQKEVGHILSKNIQRMLSDVWRNGEMIYYKNAKMICRILSHDWPSFNQPSYKLPDILLELRGDFEIQFLSQPKNDNKKLKWVPQCGKITISITGVQSVFSQLQGSIIILLSKSYRPIKAKQFKQVLEYTKNDMQAILDNLVETNIMVYNSDADNYELNYENTNPYYFDSKQKLITKTQKKKPVEKDYSSVLDALIVRILKRRKSVQKTDLAKLLKVEVMVDNYQPSVEEINSALERLRDKEVVNIDKTRGIIKYLE